MVRLRHLLLGFGIVLLTACGSDANDGAPGGSGGSGASGGSEPSADAGASGASNDGDDDDDDDDNPSGNCIPDDQDGVVGGKNTVKLYVTDTGFNVGTQDSGQRNIAVQNRANVALTLTNVGTRPHGFTIACRPTDLPAECNQPTSCFPTAANVAALQPGDAVTVMFQTPVVEGEYQFTSDEPGDEALIGEFVLM
ncbi:MAG: hypothetical protein WDO69_16310 [Pseudomonadota bacterium]